MLFVGAKKCTSRGVILGRLDFVRHCASSWMIRCTASASALGTGCGLVRRVTLAVPASVGDSTPAGGQSQNEAAAFNFPRAAASLLIQ